MILKIILLDFIINIKFEFQMTISGIAEKILLELESLGINSESLRNDISELIDLAFEAQVHCR